MKLADALRILNAARLREAPPFRVALTAGFTPLHLGTFLQARLQQNKPDRRVELLTGLFSDAIGNLHRAGGADVIVAPIEWQDLEPRLGYRQLGGWRPSQAASIVAGFTERLRHLASAVAEAASRTPVVIAPPSLPLPPAFLTPTAQAATASLEIQAAMAGCMAQLAGLPGVKLVNLQALDQAWPPSGRFDLKSELTAGFPFTIGYASELARALSDCAAPKPPGKGIITDLDDTLWLGLAGEAGPDGLSWSLDRHGQLHGLYQQILASLAEQGVLLAVASKNDASTVEQVFSARSDLLLAPDRLFPREVHWGPKSESVARILRTWNIGADSVVFLDDSPIEIGEVQAAHPGMECILFPKNDYTAALALFHKLRDRFGRDTIAAEDALRLDSIRQGQVFLSEASGPAEHQESFLSQLEAELRFSVNPPPNETRVLELVNKTNQFNLNGLRYSDAEWARLRSEQESSVVSASYRDKFGMLGTIAVAAGKRTGKVFYLQAWVMSCRAFSRRIEHRMLGFLFDHLEVEEIHLAYQQTPKNTPFASFVATLLDTAPEGPFRIRRGEFEQRCPALFHRVDMQDPEASGVLSGKGSV